MADQCDFDELAALLEEDSDDEFQEAENVPVKSEDGNRKEEIAESSGDDIDEDELDQLAGLMEADDQSFEQAEEAVMVKIKEEPKDEEHKEKVGSGENTETEEGSHKDETEEKSHKDKEEEKVAEEEEEEESEEEQEDVQEKIKQMYAMIQQLQTQVEKKSKKSESKNIKNEPSQGSDRKPHDAPASQSNKSSVKSKEKKPLTEKLKLIEDDIFSKATQDKATQDKKDATPGSSESSDSPATKKNSGKPVKKEPQTEKKFTIKEAQQQLFGSDSDSDWEGLDGEKPDEYNKSGKEIKQIIKKSENKRVAHSASCDVKALANRKPSWGKKDVYKARTAEDGPSSSYTRSVSPPRSMPLERKVEDDDKDVLCDSYSELRIINPRISSTQLKFRMEGRHMFQMSTLHRRVNTSDMEKDWVTIGVLVQKSEPKMSSKGKQYSIWTLSDLKDCQRVVKMFLFGDVHNQHWKTSIGSVMGFLNPNPMSNNEKYQNKSDDVTLCVDNSNKVMHMGQSKDFGYCKAFTKAGRKCTNFVNKYKAEFCEYHISQAYKTASAKRGDLQGGAMGPIPNKHKPDLKQKVLANKNDVVFYGGNSFSGSNTQQKKKGVSLGSLKSHEKTKGPLKKGQVTTLSLFEMRPEDAEKLEKYEEKKRQQDHKAFHEMLAAPSVGSMNLVKHLMGSKKEEKKQLSFQSVTAQDMFKTRAKVGNSKQGFSAVGSQSMVQVGSPTPSSSSSKPSPIPNVPKLGRGFTSGGSIFLESPTKKKPLGQSNAELWKKRAIEKVKRSGGVKAENPNAVKKKIDDEKQRKIKKRLCDDSDNENKKDTDNVQAKKKPRLIEGIDLEDPEIQKLLKKKSKHDNLLLAEEQEKQDEYFDILEKKEKMEAKMGEITKMKVKAVSCKKCGYTSLKAADRCREERHPLVTHEATKRFFICQHCKFRTQSLDRLPNTNCNCGKNAWQRTSMLREKKGPQLESENLVLRGEETKFLNSLQ